VRDQDGLVIEALLPAPTQQEIEQEDFMPIPQIAPGYNREQLLPWRTCHPQAGMWGAQYEIDAHMVLNGAFVRYSKALSEAMAGLGGMTWLRLSRGYTCVQQGDVFYICFRG
jgi:hypothetical protein